MVKPLSGTIRLCLILDIFLERCQDDLFLPDRGSCPPQFSGLPDPSCLECPGSTRANSVLSPLTPDAWMS